MGCWCEASLMNGATRLVPDPAKLRAPGACGGLASEPPLATVALGTCGHPCATHAPSLHCRNSGVVRRGLRCATVPRAAIALVRGPIALAAFVAAVCGSSTQPAGAQTAPAERSVSVPTRAGVRLAATVLGQRRPTIVVLHGGPGATHEYLRPEWDRLARAARVVYYDQRGCGRSTRRGPYGWQWHVSDLDAVLTRLAPGERVVLAGSSWGSHLALLYAREHPDRVAALVLSGVIPWQGLGAGLATAEDSAAAGLGPLRLLWTDTLPPRRLPLQRGRTAAWCLGATVPRAGVASMPAQEALRAVDAPALLVAGTDTSVYWDGSAALARVLPRARRVVIPGAGHDPWLERPDRFFAEVDAFLAGGGLMSQRSGVGAKW